MATNYPAIAAAGANAAWTEIESLLTSITIQQGPTPVYTSSTDATVVTWTTSTAKAGFLYNLEQKEVEAGDMDAFLEGRMKYCLIRVADYPADVTVADTVLIGSVLWQIKSVNPDPSNTIAVLMLRR